MRLTDEKLEIAIGRMLQAGVMLAALVVLVGGVLYLRQSSGAARPDYWHFHGVSGDLRSPAGIVKLAAHGDAGGLIQLGLLVLIATPIFRVVVAGVGFLMERDRMYVWVSVAVLAVLIFSLWHSH
jgi:uncharacterized membrane protein